MSVFQPPGETFRLAGKVKWFNRSKGFGFVIPNDGSGDVFLPLSVLERAGHSELPDGASIVFDWTQGPKGRAVASVVDHAGDLDLVHREDHAGGATAPA